MNEAQFRKAMGWPSAEQDLANLVAEISPMIDKYGDRHLSHEQKRGVIAKLLGAITQDIVAKTVIHR
jgi:hypothetical protein